MTVEAQRMTTTMKVELINPFVASAINVFATMFSTDLIRQPIYLRKPHEAFSGICGVIGITGEVIGTAAVNVSNDAAIALTKRFLGTEITDVNDEVIDCMGEIVNMVAGSAKSSIKEYRLSISLPSIIRGPEIILEYPTNVSPICIPFTSDIGQLFVNIGFIVKE